MAHISCSWWEALQWMEHLWVNSWPLHSVCGLGLWAHFANQWYRYRPILWWNPEPHIFWNQSWSSWWKWCCKNGIKEEFQWNFPNKNHISTQLSWNTYPFSSLMSALVLRQIFFNCLIFCRARTQYPCSFSSNSDKFVLVLHIGNKSRGNFDFNSRICNKSIGQWRTFNCSLLNSYTIRLNWIAPYDSACFSTSFSSKTKHTRNASISLLCKWMLPRKYQRSLNVQWFSWLTCEKIKLKMKNCFNCSLIQCLTGIFPTLLGLCLGLLANGHQVNAHSIPFPLHVVVPLCFVWNTVIEII